MVCDSCLDALEEEGFTGSKEFMSRFCMEIGSEIADHLCDQIETDEEIKCACACNDR